MVSGKYNNAVAGPQIRRNTQSPMDCLPVNSFHKYCVVTCIREEQLFLMESCVTSSGKPDTVCENLSVESVVRHAEQG
jgi:hypothetical protein